MSEYGVKELADKTGLPVTTIRYYEKEGLIKPIKRTKSNYKKFSDATIERLKLIEMYKGDNYRYNLQEIKNVLDGDEL